MPWYKKGGKVRLGNDLIIGGAGNDQLFGGPGFDTLRGNTGNDTLRGGKGNDTLNGGLDTDECPDQLGHNTYTNCEGHNEVMMLRLINDARAEGRGCVDTFFPAAPPLKWDDRLEAAADGHSEDMADNQHFSHGGTDGSDPGDRIMNEGYDPNAWGEAILVGYEKRSKVVDGFLASPEHCSILMDPAYEDVGVWVDKGKFKGKMEPYWTLDLATETK